MIPPTGCPASADECPPVARPIPLTARPDATPLEDLPRAGAGTDDAAQLLMMMDEVEGIIRSHHDDVRVEGTGPNAPYVT